jgi:hypothetical protein
MGGSVENNKKVETSLEGKRTRSRVELVPVVPAGYTALFRVEPFKLLVRIHHPQVPEFASLVLAIGDAIPPISLGCDKRDTFGVTDQHARRLVGPERPPVPDLDKTVVRARGEDVGRCRVGETDGVDVVVVSADP